MKIGIKLKLKWLDENSIKEIKKAGIKTVEISHGDGKNFSDEDMDFLKDLDLDHSMHSPYNNLKIKGLPWPHYNRECLLEMENALKNAIKLKASHIVVHGGAFFRGYFRLKSKIGKDYGLKFFLDKYIETFGELFKMADDNDVRVIIENLYPCFLGGRPSDLSYIQRKLPFLGFCFDFAHAEIHNQTEELMKFNIDYVHVSDNNKKEDQHLKIGEGEMDFKRFIDRLKKLNYKGKIIIENENLSDCIFSFKKLNDVVN